MSDEAPVVLSVEHLTTSFRVGGVWTPVVSVMAFDIKARETLAVVGWRRLGQKRHGAVDHAARRRRPMVGSRAASRSAGASC